MSDIELACLKRNRQDMIDRQKQRPLTAAEANYLKLVDDRIAEQLKKLPAPPARSADQDVDARTRS